MSNKNNKGYCLTINNYDSEDELKLSSLVEGGRVDYCIYGREVAPRTRTLHLQAYIHFRSGARFNYVKQLFPTAHIEASRGSSEQNAVYCRKGGDFQEYGSLPRDSRSQIGQVAKVRYEQALELARRGQCDDIDADLLVRHYSTFKQIARESQTSPASLNWDEPPNLWFYGPSGSGKSSSARRSYADYYTKDVTKWWTNYRGQSVVILDDLDPYHKSLGYYIKLWADRYPFQAELKNDGVMIRPKIVIITSQYLPEDIWDDQATIDAMRRRFQFREFCIVD